MRFLVAIIVILISGFSPTLSQEDSDHSEQALPQLEGAPSEGLPSNRFDQNSTELPPLDGSSLEPVGNQAVAVAARLRDIVQRIDPGAEFLSNGANFRVETVPVTLVYDINADRMRIVAPVTSINDLEADDLIRLMQANFDSALDARYALAQGVLWSTFIHPLSSLSSDDFGSGLGQTINLVRTYGSSYTSGALVFGGGDSQEEQRQLIEELQDKSKEI